MLVLAHAWGFNARTCLVLGILVLDPSLDFAQLSLMVNLIFIQNVPFLMQDIGTIYQILDKFYKFKMSKN